VTDTPAVYGIPSTEPISLAVRPRLESWMRHDHPDQLRLREFVAHVRDHVDPVLANAGQGSLALRLDVGLGTGVNPLHHRDLDNYLFPIARQLPHRIVSFWATKSPTSASLIRIEPARVNPAPPWPRHDIIAPGGEKTWKQAVNAALTPADRLPDGPVGMQISFAVGEGRSWTSMWKRTIDGLEPLLGRAYEDRPWNPLDGRIVRLGMHVAVDPALGDRVRATIWAAPADAEWPEVRELMAVDEHQRQLWMAAAHRVAGARSPRRAPMEPSERGATDSEATNAVSAAGERHQPNREIDELLTIADFDGALAAGALLVVTDVANPTRLHRAPARCPSVRREWFETKVIVNGGRNGQYYTVANELIASARWPKLTVCARCG
jgi:hypothetical protein